MKSGVLKCFLILVVVFVHVDSNAREYNGHLSVNYTSNGELFQILDDYKFDDADLLNMHFLKTVNNQLRKAEELVFRFILIEEKDDNFEGLVEVHQKSFSEVSKLYSYSKIVSFPVEGALNSINFFELKLEDESNLWIRMKIDKKFTMEEIKNRFEERNKKP